jgi:uncharacterized protein (TIGR02453 family)
MAAAFPGFPKQAMSFFRQLAKNNRREWFQPRKPTYDEHVRAPMIELVALLNDDLRSFAADHVVEPPARAVYRLHRDTRFAKDKTPYNTHVGALFPRPGLPKHAGAAFYVGVSHEGVEVAGGMYMPGPAELAAVRQAIAADPTELRKLLADKGLRKAVGELRGEKLARVPRGFPADHPAAELLRHKALHFFVTLPAEAALKPGIRREVASRFRAMAPVVHYLNAVLLRARREAAGDEGIPVRPAPMF